MKRSVRRKRRRRSIRKWASDVKLSFVAAKRLAGTIWRGWRSA